MPDEAWVAEGENVSKGPWLLGQEEIREIQVEKLIALSCPLMGTWQADLRSI